MLYQTQKKNVLITGGSGFLGRHLAQEIRKVHDVCATFAKRRINIPRCTTVCLNLLQDHTYQEVFKEFKPDVVVHCAAIADAKKCEESRDVTQAVNVTGAEKLMRALPNKDALFIYISTDLVFGGNDAPYNEQAQPEPVSVYGKSKRMAEQAVQKTWKNHVILRPSLIFGAAHPSGNGSFLQWMDTAFQEQDEVQLFNDEFRTPVYVKDICKAVSSLIVKVGHHRMYHLGGPERISRADFARKLAAVRGYDVNKIKETSLSELDTGYPRPKDVSLDSARMIEAHALRQTPIEDALKEIFSAV